MTYNKSQSVSQFIVAIIQLINTNRVRNLIAEDQWLSKNRWQLDSSWYSFCGEKRSFRNAIAYITSVSSYSSWIIQHIYSTVVSSLLV